MGDGMSTSFTNMGFNALSNSEYEYGENQYDQNNDPNLSVGESLVLAATSNKLFSANNGSAITGDLTSAATATGLLNTITSVAIGDNLTVVAGTNQDGITTAPIIFSANGVKYSKSTLAAANFQANVVHYNRFGKVFYVGNTSTAGNVDSAITYVPPNGQGMALAAGASDLFPNPGNRCRAIYSVSPGVSADPVTFLGGSAGAAAALGFSPTVNLATIPAFVGGAGTPNNTNGSVNAISCDDGLSDLTNYYVLVGGAFVGAVGTTSNLVYTSSLLRANPIAAQVFVNNEATAAGIFPAGVGASSVNAIAFNGSVFLVGGLGNAGGVGNAPVVAISTFVPGVPPAAGTFTFATPDNCNIGSLVTNVNSLTWNGTYWIAGGTSTNGFVLLKSVDAVTWSYISGAVTGATTALAVASKYQISTDVTNVQYTSGFGPVTQLGAVGNPVTLNAPCGDITLVAHAVAQVVGNVIYTFTLNNSIISANDLLVLNVISPPLSQVGCYIANAACANGSAAITITCISNIAAAVAPTLRFAVVHCN